MKLCYKFFYAENKKSASRLGSSEATVRTLKLDNHLVSQQWLE